MRGGDTPVAYKGYRFKLNNNKRAAQYIATSECYVDKTYMEDHGFLVRCINLKTGYPQFFNSLREVIVEEDDDNYDKHLGCQNWPNCDIAGCGSN